MIPVEWDLDVVMQRVTVTESGCWRWNGSTDRGGYGALTARRKFWIAHRFVYTLLVGPIPGGSQLDHTCHTADLSCPGGDSCPHRRCVNPSHLEPVTSSENGRRSRLSNRTHCIHGHLLTARTTWVTARGGRRCRECLNVKQRAYRKKLKDAA